VTQPIVWIWLGAVVRPYSQLSHEVTAGVRGSRREHARGNHPVGTAWLDV